MLQTIVNQRPVTRSYRFSSRTGEKNVIGLRDFYKRYPYKKRPFDSNIRIGSALKHTVVEDHKYSVCYKDWLNIINTFFDTLLECLHEGYAYNIPYNLGTIEIYSMYNTKNSKYGFMQYDWTKLYLKQVNKVAYKAVPMKYKHTKPFKLKRGIKQIVRFTPSEPWRNTLVNNIKNDSNYHSNFNSTKRYKND